MLTRLHHVIESGSELNNSRWQEDIEVVVEALWPNSTRGNSSKGATLHRQLSMIAADTARWLKRDHNARLEWELKAPLDVAIHDGFLEASKAGPKTYASWCLREGSMLLTKKMNEQMRNAMRR